MVLTFPDHVDDLLPGKCTDVERAAAVLGFLSMSFLSRHGFKIHRNTFSFIHALKSECGEGCGK
nr:hypothetical protein [Candidatus Sigynarchaeum springense]